MGSYMKRERKSKRKKKTCDVRGCDEKKKKSVPIGKAKNKADLDVDADGTSAYLCKKHWKEFKKATKKEREMRRLSWD